VWSDPAQFRSPVKAALEIEQGLIVNTKWRTKLELAIAIAGYIEHFYNPVRRHSSLAYLTPNEFDGLHSTTIHQVALS